MDLWQTCRRIAPLAIAIFTTSAIAAPLSIIATPTETSGGFHHNVFHTSNSNGGASGSVIVWLDLDTNPPFGGNTWDPVTGELSITLNMFSDSALTSQVGSVIGSSGGTSAADPLLASGFNTSGNQDGGALGEIRWIFNGAGLAYMNSWTTVASNNKSFQTFVDRNYVTSQDGHQANTWENGYMTLWGSDTDALIDTDTTGANFATGQTTFGTDLVLQIVPVPAAAWLFGSALGVLGWLRRRSML